MVFSSVVFLVYFLPLFLLFYFIINPKYKNAFLIFSSVAFYSWGAPKFIFVILFTTFADFHLVKFMSRSASQAHRKLFLIASVSINLGLLFYFKYSDFFVQNLNHALHFFGAGHIGWVKLILPIGISFYTFETITYVVDVYRKVHKPLDNFGKYLLYIILFPKLIAGPIIRYHELADQLNDRSQNENNENRLTGFYRFALGLGKKVLIANQMAVVADAVFSSDYHHISASAAWLGSLAYTFQIYFDFSGYSDMAIGLGKIIGFRFPENFNNPYISQSITEFWRRWHISLGNWMKNYLYIPLGGNKVSRNRLYFNLGIVFIASGFWHGASWSFIFWGAYHGFFLVIERLFLGGVLSKIGKIPAIVFTFLMVNFGWVFFRVEKIKDAFRFIKHMLIPHTGWHFQPDAEFLFWMAMAVLFSFFAMSKRTQQVQDKIYFAQYGIARHVLVFIIALSLFVLSLSSITSFGFNPFIYFRF